MKNKDILKNFRDKDVESELYYVLNHKKRKGDIYPDKKWIRDLKKELRKRKLLQLIKHF